MGETKAKDRRQRTDDRRQREARRHGNAAKKLKRSEIRGQRSAITRPYALSTRHRGQEKRSLDGELTLLLIADV
jgi:hypothetical protein